MKIKLKPMQQVFFTSDTHFGHKNICKATSTWTEGRGNKTRDFQSLTQMNLTLIEKINAKVGEDDILFHLGDWSFGGIENIWSFRSQIICKNIHIIPGNHDHHIESDKILPNCHWDIYDESVIKDSANPNKYGDSRDLLFNVNASELFKSRNKLTDLTIQVPTGDKEKDKKFRFVLCHFPIASWKDMGEGVMHLHGHVHLPENKKIGKGRHLDVGVDGNSYSPYSLTKVVRILKDKEISPLILTEDHHER